LNEGSTNLAVRFYEILIQKIKLWLNITLNFTIKIFNDIFHHQIIIDKKLYELMQMKKYTRINKIDKKNEKLNLSILILNIKSIKKYKVLDRFKYNFNFLY